MNPSVLWVDLLKGSRFLKEPFLVHDAFNTELFSEEDVRKVLRAMSTVSRGEAARGLRVYVNGGSNADIEHSLTATPPEEGESLEHWCLRVLPDAPFGIIVNHVEQWDDDLAQRLARFVVPFIELHGLPLGSIEITFFMGNYGYTPFGVHFDGGRAHVLHFHLGPNDKTMFIWSGELFESLTGSRDSFFAPEQIIEHAKAMRITSNAVFFLPSDKYHIGYTHGFSTALALAISEETMPGFVYKAVRLELENRSDISPVAWIERCKDSGSNVVNLITNSLGQSFIKQACNRYLLGILSNGGLSTSPPLNKTSTLADIDCRFMRLAPFKLYFDAEDKQNAWLFARGYRIPLPCASSLSEFCDAFNSDSISSIDDAAKYLGSAWNAEDIRGLCCKLDRCKAVTVNGE